MERATNLKIRRSREAENYVMQETELKMIDDQPVKTSKLKMALEDQKKLTSIHNALVVMLTICRGEKVCQLLKRGD